MHLSIKTVMNSTQYGKDRCIVCEYDDIMIPSHKYGVEIHELKSTGHHILRKTRATTYKELNFKHMLNNDGDYHFIKIFQRWVQKESWRLRWKLPCKNL